MASEAWVGAERTAGVKTNTWVVSYDSRNTMTVNHKNSFTVGQEFFYGISRQKNYERHFPMRLIHLKETETLKTRLSKYSISEDLERTADDVKSTGEVGFGTFHTFDAE